MIGLGVRAGDRVAIWSPNTWHWVVACLATHYAGAAVVPLNTRYTAEPKPPTSWPAPRRRCWSRWAGSWAPTGWPTSTAPRCPTCGTSCGCRSRPDDDDGHVGRLRRRAAGADVGGRRPRRRAVRPDDVSDILFTSGTTGRSKGVLCAHRQSLAGLGGVGGVRQAHQRRPLPVHQPVLPQLRLQGRHPGLPADRRHPDPAADLRPRAGDAGGRASTASPCCPGPPTIFQTLLDHPARPSYDLSSLRFAVTGAATVPVVLIERMQAELDFDIVLTAYGLTEATASAPCAAPRTTR